MDALFSLVDALFSLVGSIHPDWGQVLVSLHVAYQMITQEQMEDPNSLEQLADDSDFKIECPFAQRHASNS